MGPWQSAGHSGSRLFGKWTEYLAEQVSPASASRVCTRGAGSCFYQTSHATLEVLGETTAQAASGKATAEEGCQLRISSRASAG